MRIINTFSDEELAKKFSHFLHKKGIENKLEANFDHKTNSFSYQVWGVDEDQLSIASSYLQSFEKNPYHPSFTLPKEAYSAPPTLDTPSTKETLSENSSSSQKPSSTASFLSEKNSQENESFPPKNSFQKEKKLYPNYRYKMTATFFAICLFLFVLNLMQTVQITKANKSPIPPVTPVQSFFMYDEPTFQIQLIDLLNTYKVDMRTPIEEQSPAFQKAFENLMEKPIFRGIYPLVLEKWQGEKPATPPLSSMFVKIREGQIWRFFTPIFLHGGIIHILFNMLWLWVLGKQIEPRLSKGKYLLLVLICAIISNTAQYLMSGPNFVGFSGVIMGMVGFIWMRQKIAPWEGYPLQKVIYLFLGIYIGAMFFLQLFSFFTQSFGLLELELNIANTAHIVGAIVGALLGRMHFFSWRSIE